MKYTTHKGKTYTVTTSESCTITSDTGILLCTAEPGKQASFVAIGSTIEVDSEAAEITENATKATNASGLNASSDIQFTGNLNKINSEELNETSLLNQAEGDSRWKISFDTTPKSGSANAVTSGGLFNLLKESGIAIGRATVTPEFYGISIGSESSTKGWGAISMGKDAKVNGAASISIGANVQADTSIGLGRLLTVKDAGVVAMAPPNKTNPQTIFYLIGASTPLANTYENGEACLGYVVKDSSGNILACGTRKLSELLTNNTAFAPAALDLDAPAPTPFLPTGITDPIELHQETEQ